MIVLPRELGHQLPAEADVGAKAHHLVQLMHLKSRVPRFGILAASAFDAQLSSDSIQSPLAHAIRLTEKVEDSVETADNVEAEAAAAALSIAIRNAPLSSRVQAALDELVEAFTEADLLAVRPSTVGSAAETLALAGHLETFLFVRGKAAVREAVHLVFASAFCPAVVDARRSLGLAPYATRLGVVVQRMVMADTSGAAASLDIDAAAGRPPQVIVEATLGVGGGSSRPKSRLSTDSFLIARPLLAEGSLDDNARVEIDVVQKREALVLDEAQGHGTKLSPTSKELSDVASLTAVQARVVADEALRLESLTGRPVAVEFAFSGRLLHILQMHPLETPEGRIASTTKRVFDGRVLPDDIAGPALPITQAWARATVGPGLEDALKELGVKQPMPVEVKRALSRLVGTVEGDLVGNASALRACIGALDHGDCMSGALGNALSLEALDPHARGEVARRELSTFSRWRMGRQIGKRVQHLQDDADALRQKIHDDSERIRFSGIADLDPDRIADYIDDVATLCVQTRSLQWRAQILWSISNDLVTEGLSREELGATKETAADLCTPSLPPSSVQLAKRISQLGKLVADTPVLASLFSQESRSEFLLDRLEELPDARAFDAKFRSTIDHEGVLIAEHAALENPTFEERPDLLLDLVRRHIPGPDQKSENRVAVHTTLEKKMGAALGRRKKAEYLVSSQVQGRALLFFKKSELILAGANAAREAAHVQMLVSRLAIRLGGVGRQCLLALGTRLYEHDLLDQPADALWLYLDEMVGAVRGSVAEASLRTLVSARKRAYSQFSDKVPQSLTLTGVVAAGTFTAEVPPMATSDIEDLKAEGAAPGEQLGRVVRMPTLDSPFVVESGSARDNNSAAKRSAGRRSTDNKAPAIVLVVPRLELTWLGALCQADAVVAERGTKASAVAMILHALAIPCVIGATHALSILEDGEEVIVDGNGGTVVRTNFLNAEDNVAAATAPEDFARLAAPSSEAVVRPAKSTPVIHASRSIDLDASNFDESNRERKHDEEDRTATFIVPHTLAVDPDQVESVELDLDAVPPGAPVEAANTALANESDAKDLDATDLDETSTAIEESESGDLDSASAASAASSASESGDLDSPSPPSAASSASGDLDSPSAASAASESGDLDSLSARIDAAAKKA